MERIREELIEVAKMMYGRGMVNAFEGNLSVRESARVYVTPSGRCKGTLTPEMITVTDLDGRVVEGALAPSSELKLHLAAYRLRRDVSAVIHSHAPYSTAFAIAGRPIESRAYPEMVIAFGKIPLVEYGAPSTDDIHKGLSKVIGRCDVMLLANHGILSLGADITEAFYKMEQAESIAKTLLLTRLLGGEAALAEEQLGALYEMRRARFDPERME